MANLILYSDPLIALMVLLGFTWAYLRGSLSRPLYLLFWVGVGLGLCWELPLFLAGPEFSENPPYRLLSPFPIHPHLQWIGHSLWDGGLFMAGLGLVFGLRPAPHLRKFDFRELAVLILWGIGSAIVLEIIGSLGIWEYIPSWWNPELFQVNGRSITALAPLTWMIAPIPFYLIGLHLLSD